MTLADAISSNAKTLGEAQTTYKEQVVLVNTLVNGVLTSNLPTLNTSPPDWQDFVNAYVAARTDALNWVNNVLARLLSVPDEVQNYNTIIVNLLSDAGTQAGTLVNNPNDQAALAALNQDLTMLPRQLNIVTTFISGAVTAIRNFQDKMPDMAAQLNAIATKSINDSNADKTKIDGLNQTINQMNADIQALTAAIVGLSIAAGIALVMGTVITIAAWPFGALAWLFLGPAVAAATTFIALDAQKITADKNAITVAQQQLPGLNADVATLSVLSNSYTQLASQAQAVEAALQAILAAWQNLESDVVEAVTDLQTAIAQAGQQAYALAQIEIQEAQGAWNDAYAAAGALHLDLQISNAQLESGMSSAQVQQALAAGQTVDAITYYNSVGAS